VILLELACTEPEDTGRLRKTVQSWPTAGSHLSLIKLLQRLHQRLDRRSARAVTAGPQRRHDAELAQARNKLAVRGERTGNIAGRRPEIDDPAEVCIRNHGDQRTLGVRTRDRVKIDPAHPIRQRGLLADFVAAGPVV
jgi:hypothetical protein